jgi:ABC-2 type transport system permease protein
MIHDAYTVMWKEGKELFRLRGSSRGGTLGVVFFLCVFGIFLPLQMGLNYVQSNMVLILWVWVPLFLVSSVVADAFAGERERHTLETLLSSRLSDRAILFGKVGAAIAYGWGLSMLSLFVGLVTVNIAYYSGTILFFTPIMCLGLFLWSFLGAGLTGCAGVLVSLKAATVRQAQQTLSISIMLLFFVPFFGVYALPDLWKERIFAFLATITVPETILLVAGVLALIDLLLLKAALVRFRRDRLILD